MFCRAKRRGWQVFIPGTDCCGKLGRFSLFRRRVLIRGDRPPKLSLRFGNLRSLCNRRLRLLGNCATADSQDLHGRIGLDRTATLSVARP